MKRLLFLIIALTLTGAVASAQSNRNTNNTRRVDETAVARDANSNKSGVNKEDKSVVKDVTIKDSNGKNKGTIKVDGTVYDDKGKKIGSIGDDGVVRDATGKKLGTASGKNKEKAALQFLFK